VEEEEHGGEPSEEQRRRRRSLKGVLARKKTGGIACSPYHATLLICG
jgi:hypothetical protein